MPHPQHEGSHYTHASDIGARAAMTVAKHRGLPRAGLTTCGGGPVRRAATTLFYENPVLQAQEVKDVADVGLDWTALDNSWSFVALDRVAWAWSSARRH